jgi:hypothetical protein
MDESHQVRAGRVGGDGIVGKHDLAERTRGAVEWAITFRRNDSVRNYEADWNGGAYVENAFLDALPVKDIFRPSGSNCSHPRRLEILGQPFSCTDRSSWRNHQRRFDSIPGISRVSTSLSL